MATDGEPSTADLAALLRAIRSDQRRLIATQQRLAVELQRMRCGCHGADQVARLAPATDPMAVLAAHIFERWAGMAWTGREVIERASLPQNHALAEAVRTVVGRLDLDAAARSLGRRLALAASSPAGAGGYAFVRVGDCNSGALWVCRQLAARQTHQTHLEAPELSTDR